MTAPLSSSLASLSIHDSGSPCARDAAPAAAPPYADAARQFAEAGASGQAAPHAVPDTASEPGDPLYPYQWHLHNTGQYAFAKDKPRPGIDLNIGDLHRTGITGKGVIVGVRELAVIDQTHEDLAANMVLRHAPQDGQGEPRSPHATMVAGVIAGIAGNGKGGRGVAPEAQILDMTRSDAGDMPVPRVINESMGSVMGRYESYGTYRWSANLNDARQDAPLIVKSAGNNFLGNAELREAFFREHPEIAEDNHVGFRSANVKSDSSLWNSMTVGAVNARGEKASYSMTGSSLWVSGLGGEGGLEAGASVPENISHLPDSARHQPAITTTDLPGRDRGHHAPDADFFGRFHNGLETADVSPLDPNGDYTARFNGTSAAAPTVTGVAALMLQANPKLSWRDIKYLLAITARKVDAGRQPIRWQGITLEDSWVANAAKRSFSNWYGFGLVDAKRAVEAARVFRGLPPAVDSGWHWTTGEPMPIPYRDENAGYSPLHFDQDMKVESVQIRLRTTHTEPRNLRIALISPSGTRSIIVPPLTDLAAWPDEPFSINRVATNAFLDENAKGIWKLQVIDVLDPHADTRTLVDWDLRVMGH